MRSLLRLPRLAPLLACVVALAAAGCRDAPAPGKLVAVTPPAPEVPVANLPADMRPYNWTDSGGSGSCVNASTVFQLLWRNNPELAEKWRKTYAGGETDSSIRRHHDREGLNYRYTVRAEADFLDWCTATRRGAIIWYYPRHCVTFCGFHRDTDGTTYAYINDNNRPQRYIKIERAEFLRKWRDYGGFALSILDPPVPPPLFPAYTRNS